MQIDSTFKIHKTNKVSIELLEYLKILNKEN